MKAYVLHGINDLRYEDVEIRDLKADEALVKVMAVGICGSDIPRIYETGAHKHPLIPGHEFSGQVVKVGTTADVFWEGKRVGIFPLIPCRNCASCKSKLYEMCRNYSYLGSRTDGGFAEYVIAPVANLIELPDLVSYEQAAMLEPMAVAAHAVRKILAVNGITDFDSLTEEEKNVYKNKTLLVCGLGTIGLLIVMLLKNMGFENLLAIGNKEFQREQILKLGMDSDTYCDCKKEDASAWIMKKTSNLGVDMFFECVGKNETVTWAIANVAPAGSIILVGNPYSDMKIDKNIYWKILRNQVKITGTWNSSFTNEENDDWHYVLNCIVKNQFKPESLISHRLSFDALKKGLCIMHDKTEDYVKVMILGS